MEYSVITSLGMVILQLKRGITVKQIFHFPTISVHKALGIGRGLSRSTEKRDEQRRTICISRRKVRLKTEDEELNSLRLEVNRSD